MLSVLRIDQLAIIDSLELELGPGLNVLTGETGAGKSILVGALKLVLGGKARPELVRSGAEAAEVEALFEVSDNPRVAERLRADGLEAADELVIRRVVTASGRSRAYVNGRLTSAEQLVRLSAGLVDISSQHQHHSLVDASEHIHYLDAAAGLGGLRETMAAQHQGLSAALAARRSAELAERSRAEREDFLRFQLEEVRKLNPKAGEDEALREEGDRLRHAGRLAEIASGGERALQGGRGALCDRLSLLESELREGAAVEASFAELASRIHSARLDLIEVARDLQRAARSFPDDPRRLSEIDERQAALKRLLRRFGPTLDELLAWRQGAEAELLALADNGARIEALGEEIERLRGQAALSARALSARRREVADQLGAGITAELQTLGMGGARVEVSVAALGGKGDVEVDGARLTALGVDQVEFLIAPNPGEQPRPLRQVASGGELSRALLALKQVLAGLGPVGLYVFDEVDTGVGGAVAEVIGRKLWQVAQPGQALCITHLPQVAAWGDRHLRVEKQVREGRTHSGVVRLPDGEARVEELARMLGGVVVTAGARQAAADLLDQATAWRRSVR